MTKTKIFVINTYLSDLLTPANDFYPVFGCEVKGVEQLVTTAETAGNNGRLFIAIAYSWVEPLSAYFLRKIIMLLFITKGSRHPTTTGIDLVNL